MAFKNWAMLALAGSVLTAGPALAQNYPSRTVTIVSPAAGASVSDPVTVSFSLGGDSAGAGAAPMSGHHHGGQAYLVVDGPAPAAGDAIQADPKHIAFPAGQHQLSVSLPAGRHELQVVFANHQSQVSSHMAPSAPVTVTVR